MSWWDDSNDVLGDGPADTLKAAWRTLLGRREQDGRPLPTSAEALGSFAAALRAAALQPPFESLTIWRDRDRVTNHDGTGGVNELTQAFAEAIRLMAQDYQERFERPPSPSELIKTLEFILNPHPQDYLSDATKTDWEHLRLRAG